MKNNGQTDIIELLLGCRAGDNSAFEKLVAVYTPMISSVIAAKGLDYDELFSDAALALYKAACTYNVEQSEVTFGLYAKVCVTNRITDILRADKAEKALVLDYDVENLTVSDGILSMLEKQEERERFHACAKDALSDYEYRVLKHWLSGEKTAAIAASLSTDAKSVDNAKSRILKKLRAAFSDGSRH